MGLREVSVEVVADLLRHAKAGEPKACLLIGAGASKTAGIGLARDYVDRIKNEYPSIYKKASVEFAGGGEPTYAQCMAALPPARQVQLVRSDIDKSKINWAHIGIARLEREEVVDAILTPNFDPLASRACALFNRFPAIYDLAGLRDESERHIGFDKSYVRGSAIFHLHGQHTGFLLLNTQDKLKAQAKRIRPVLDAVMRGKPVVIAGYSGENDPLIEEIAGLSPFNHGLFWVGYNDQDPAPNVCNKLLTLPDCHVIRSYPSDKFFTDLANLLELKPPGFLVSPFAHMKTILATLRPYSDVGKGSENDLLSQAISQLETADSSLHLKRPEKGVIAELLSTGRHTTVYERYSPVVDGLEEEDRALVANAAGLMAAEAWDKTYGEKGSAAEPFFEEADRLFSEANEIQPGSPSTLSYWGALLLDWAKNKRAKKTKNGLIDRAEEKLREAEAIQEGSGSYNLACAFGLRENAEKSARLLLRAKELDKSFPDCAFIAQDRDFNAVRDSDVFKAAMAQIGC